MIETWIKLGLVAGLLIGFIDGGDVKQILSHCCTAGEDLAVRGETCSDLNPPLDVVPTEMISSCLFSSEICCAAKVRIEDCKTGVLAAKNGNDCHGNVTDFYTSCCESCKIGMVIGASENECELQIFQYGIPFDDAYTFCCRDAKAEGIFYMPEGDHDICSKFDRLCSQICVNTDDSYVCKCEAGFTLQEDKITCVPIEPATETLDNEVFGNHTEDCETGYARQTDKNECADINECENGDVVTCNIETQVCYNTPGSYKCLDILSGTPDAVETVKKCPPGHRHNAKTDECNDINECLEQIDNCNPNTQLCLNRNGDFECQERVHQGCASGFQYDDALKECQDIDECEIDKPCPLESNCMNTPGGFECVAKKPKKSPRVNELVVLKKPRSSCAEGFKHYFDKCIDIDECSSDPNSCDSNQDCINLPGGFQCKCKHGFIQDKVTSACIDINECQINDHECLETQRCDNTIGSYTCIRLQSCGTGYTLNAGTGQCDDDDECALNRHNCVKPYECRNTKGSFRCDRPRITTTRATTTRPTTTVSTLIKPTPTRPTPYPQRVHLQTQQYRAQSTPTPLTTSYARNEDYDRFYGPCNNGFERNTQGACADIDECYQQNPCRRNQRCINTNGSYRCISLVTCSGGYTSNEEGTQCIDIDECANGEANCAPDQSCRNKPGGYTCTCPDGHVFKDHRCEDINECEFYKGQVCPTNTECRNTVGSYRCECTTGFKKVQEDDKVCIDIDECTEIQGLCSQRCINYWGSYRCACETGYQLSQNNRTCDDIDECEVHKSYNLCVGICENTPGSYRCNCPDGYHLGTDNRSCQDIDECETGNYCRGHNEICTNVRGSYRCTQIQCPSDYVKDTEKKNRCKRISLICEEGDIPCYQKPSSYTYNFVTIVAATPVPPHGRGLFTLRGPDWYENIDFDFKIVNSRSRIGQRVDERFFKLSKMHNEVLLSLMQSLEGPQDIEIELSMTVYTNGQPRGTNVQRIFIIVSEFSY